MSDAIAAADHGEMQREAEALATRLIHEVNRVGARDPRAACHGLRLVLLVIAVQGAQRRRGEAVADPRYSPLMGWEVTAASRRIAADARLLCRMLRHWPDLRPPEEE